MNIFVDTNIWVYATDDSSPFYPDAVRKLSDMQASGHRMVISTQTLREYAKACTSARVLAHRDIVNNMDWMRRQFSVLDETALVIAELEKLLVSLVPPPIGKPVYDCNVVATMLHYGIGTILTHNVKDFTPRYDAWITVVPMLTAAH